jgi:hypothetical protein
MIVVEKLKTNAALVFYTNSECFDLTYTTLYFSEVLAEFLKDSDSGLTQLLLVGGNKVRLECITSTNK